MGETFELKNAVDGAHEAGEPRLCADRSEAKTLDLGFKERFGMKKKILRFSPEDFFFTAEDGT